MGRLGGVLALTLSALKASAAPRNDHCFLDKVNETVLTTRDLLDWPLDPLRPWWTRVVDARIDPKKCERSDYLPPAVRVAFGRGPGRRRFSGRGAEAGLAKLPRFLVDRLRHVAKI